MSRISSLRRELMEAIDNGKNARAFKLFAELFWEFKVTSGKRHKRKAISRAAARRMRRRWHQ